MNVPDTILSTLQTLKPYIRRNYRVEELALFGSVVRGEQQPDSDIDLLVDFGQGASLFDLVGLALFLEDELQRKVDIVPRESLRSEIREAVLHEAVTV